MKAGRRAPLAAIPLALAVLAGAPDALLAGERTVELAMDGEARFRPETRTNNDLDSSIDDGRVPVLSRLRLGFKAETESRVKLYVQIQDSRAFGDEASTGSNEKNVDLHQGYIEVKDLFGKGSLAGLGRAEWAYGNERLIGAFNWDNVGRAFDGARLRLKTGSSKLDFLWARVGRATVAAGAETGQDLFGAYWSYPGSENTLFEAYSLGYRDGANKPGEIRGEARRTLLGAFGVHARTVIGGRGDAEGEIVLERGEIAGDDLRAWAFGGSAGVRLGDETIVRPFVGFDFATGDSDPQDGERGEMFNFFPTNHLHYGDMDLSGWRNLVSPYVGVEVKRSGRKVLLRVHRFDLDQEKGPWKDAGGNVLGKDPTGKSGRRVGTEIDVSFTTPIVTDLSLYAGYGHFVPGDFAKATRGEDATDFAYAQLRYAFSFPFAKRAP